MALLKLSVRVTASPWMGDPVLQTVTANWAERTFRRWRRVREVGGRGREIGGAQFRDRGGHGHDLTPIKDTAASGRRRAGERHGGDLGPRDGVVDSGRVGESGYRTPAPNVKGLGEGA